MKIRRIKPNDIPFSAMSLWKSSGSLLSDANKGQRVYAALDSNETVRIVVSVNDDGIVTSIMSSCDDALTNKVVNGIQNKLHHSNRSNEAGHSDYDNGNDVANGAVNNYIPNTAGVQKQYHPRLSPAMPAANDRSFAFGGIADANQTMYRSYADIRQDIYAGGPGVATKPSDMALPSNGKKNHSALKAFITIIVFIMIIFAALSAIVIIVGPAHLRDSLPIFANQYSEEDPYIIPYNDSATLTVEYGEGTFDVKNKLYDLGFPEAADNLEANISSLGQNSMIQAGTYTLYGSETAEEIAERLVSGKSIPYGIIGVNEGDEIRTIANAIDNDGTLKFTGDDFNNACNDIAAYRADYTMLSSVPETVTTVEGFIPSGTYRLRECNTADEAVRIMLDDGQKRFEESGMSADDYYEKLIVASMVEKEAGFDEDRPLIASVIYNRLNAGMTLSIDATVKYALGSDEARVTYNDTEVESPYNTYQNNGLPIGPICCGISDESFDAAVNPADTDYLYYVLSDKEGHHAFSSTSEQFEIDRQHYLDLFGYTDDVTADEQNNAGIEQNAGDVQVN